MRETPPLLLTGYFALCALVCAGVIWLPMSVILGRMVPDDGFYYLQIARNLARLHRQTFDTIHWTNGYHPLWGWILAALAWPLREARSETLLRAALVLNAVVYAGGIYAFARPFRAALPRIWRGVLLTAGAFFFTSYTWLMETALVVGLLGLLVGWVVRASGPGVAGALRDWVVLGVILAALGLARLDSVFLAGPLFLLALFRRWGGVAPSALNQSLDGDPGLTAGPTCERTFGPGPKAVGDPTSPVGVQPEQTGPGPKAIGGPTVGAQPERTFRLGLDEAGGVAAGSEPERTFGPGLKIKGAMVAAATAALLLLPWLLFTRITSGHWGTISGALKMHAAVTPPEHSLARSWGLIDPLTKISVAACIVYLGVLAFRKFRIQSSEFRIITAVAAGGLLHFAFHLFFVPWQGFAWTFTFQRLALLLIAAHGAERLLQFRIQNSEFTIKPVAVAACIAILTPWLFKATRDFKNPTAWTYHAYRATRFINTQLPVRAVLATKDAGVLGYFSRRPVVNLDGLVNNWAYQDALRSDRHVEFLTRAGVTHLVQHNAEDYAIDKPYRFWFYSALYSHEATPLHLPVEKLIYTGPPYSHGAHNVHVAIWQFP